MVFKNNLENHFFYQWSWWDSNPRPNRETIRFLHVYSGLHFRATARPGPPTATLSSKNFITAARPVVTISEETAPLIQNVSEKELSERCLVSAPCAEIKPVTYYTSVRQRERNYFRQLNC